LDWTLLVILFGLEIGLVTLITVMIRHTFKGDVKVAVASLLGVIAGITGGSHGLGEILQGNVAPNGIVIEAWPALTLLVGEPAMTLIPNFFVTGILATILGILVTIVAAVYIHRKNGGLVLILLSIMMLAVGGGIIPPVIGIIAGIIGTRIKHGKGELPPQSSNLDNEDC
jgi:hypothetical protein